jgi:ABC-type transporter Mla subunit MlaD
MTHPRNNLKAGLFIIVSVLLVLAVVVGIKGVGAIVTPMDTHRVSFTLTDDLSGLAVGDGVRLGGVAVGNVKGIAFDTASVEGKPTIMVTFTAPQRFELRQDAVVAVQGTITGNTWLNIESLGAGPVASAPLVGRPSAMSQLLAGLGAVAPELKGTLVDVRTQTIPKVNKAVDGFADTGPSATRLINHVDEKVDPLAEKVSGLADAGTGALGNIRDIAGDSKTDFRTTVANLSAVTTSAKEKVPSILEKVDDAAAKAVATVEGARVAVGDLQATLGNTRDLTGNARSVLVRNRGKIDAMVVALKTTGDNLKAASAEIRRSPWRLLYKPGPGEMANLNLYDAARQFAEGATDLSDAAVSLRDAASDPDARPEAIEKLLERLNESFGNFQTVEQKLWTSVK